MLRIWLKTKEKKFPIDSLLPLFFHVNLEKAELTTYSFLKPWSSDISICACFLSTVLALIHTSHVTRSSVVHRLSLISLVSWILCPVSLGSPSLLQRVPSCWPQRLPFPWPTPGSTAFSSLPFVSLCFHTPPDWSSHPHSCL